MSEATKTAPAPAGGVSYRVLPKGAGLIFTGEQDPASFAFLTFPKGAVVEGADLDLALELEARGLVEVLG